MSLPVVGEKLALEPGDVHADRAFSLARAALEAQVEHLADAFVAKALYDGHIVPSSVLRHAPRPLHISTAPLMPPQAE